MCNTEFEHRPSETLHQWVKRISPKMREMSAPEHLNMMFDVVMECYVTGAREAVKSSRKVRDMKMV